MDKADDDEPKTERFNMFISKSEMEAIEEWAWNNRVRSKSDAVRRLVKIGIIFDEAREGLIKGTRSHFSKQQALISAIVKEMETSGRFIDRPDEVGLALIRAFADASQDNNKFAMLLSSIIRPVNIVRREDGLSEDAARGSQETAEFFRRMVAEYEEAFPEKEKDQ